MEWNLARTKGPMLRCRLRAYKSGLRRALPTGGSWRQEARNSAARVLLARAAGRGGTLSQQVAAGLEQIEPGRLCRAGQR
jgi:hypothetical protein